MNLDSESVALGSMIRESLEANAPERLATPAGLGAILGATINGSTQMGFAFVLLVLAIVLPFAILVMIPAMFSGGSS